MDSKVSALRLNAERYVIVLNKSGLKKQDKKELLHKFIQKCQENNFKHDYSSSYNSRYEIITFWDNLNEELQKQLI